MRDPIGQRIDHHLSTLFRTENCRGSAPSDVRQALDVETVVSQQTRPKNLLGSRSKPGFDHHFDHHSCVTGLDGP